MRYMKENGVSATPFFMSFMFLLSKIALRRSSTSANPVAQ